MTGLIMDFKVVAQQQMQFNMMHNVLVKICPNVDKCGSLFLKFHIIMGCNYFLFLLIRMTMSSLTPCVRMCTTSRLF